jgi:hypothetical protein
VQPIEQKIFVRNDKARREIVVIGLEFEQDLGHDPFLVSYLHPAEELRVDQWFVDVQKYAEDRIIRWPGIHRGKEVPLGDNEIMYHGRAGFWTGRDAFPDAPGDDDQVDRRAICFLASHPRSVGA